MIENTKERRRKNERGAKGSLSPAISLTLSFLSLTLSRYVQKKEEEENSRSLLIFYSLLVGVTVIVVDGVAGLVPIVIIGRAL